MSQIPLDSLFAATRLLSEYCDAVAASLEEGDCAIDREELLMVLDFTDNNVGLKRAVDAIYRYLQQRFATKAPTWSGLISVPTSGDELSTSRLARPDSWACIIAGSRACASRC